MMSLLRYGRSLLAIGMLSLGGSVYANDGYGGCGSPCGCGPMAAPAAYYATVTVCEMVPVQQQVQVTRVRMEARQETYTAYRCEMVPEQRQVTRTVLVPRTETVNQTFTRYVNVPYQEQRQVTVVRCVPQQVQQMVTQCVPSQEQQT